MWAAKSHSRLSHTHTHTRLRLAERGEEDSGSREEAGEMTGREVKYQRWDEGLIHIQGQLGLKGGWWTVKARRIFSPVTQTITEKERRTRQTGREEAREKIWERSDPPRENQTVCLSCSVVSERLVLVQSLSGGPGEASAMSQIG